MLWGERRRYGTFGASNNPMECAMLQSNDLSRSIHQVPFRPGAVTLGQ
jgi:hypothetical protein